MNGMMDCWREELFLIQQSKNPSHPEMFLHTMWLKSWSILCCYFLFEEKVTKRTFEIITHGKDNACSSTCDFILQNAANLRVYCSSMKSPACPGSFQLAGRQSSVCFSPDTADDFGRPFADTFTQRMLHFTAASSIGPPA